MDDWGFLPAARESLRAWKVTEADVLACVRLQERVDETSVPEKRLYIWGSLAVVARPNERLIVRVFRIADVEGGSLL